MIIISITYDFTTKSGGIWNFAPFNYIRFLDYATSRLFLRKVGGGYIFIHRMLLEYFAALHQTSAEEQS